jgi:hypothetical protein
MVEKIRTDKGGKGKFGDKFNLNKFKELDGIHIMLDYAQSFLETLGTGSSRRAFLLSGKYVLKIALNEKGLAQNQAEMDVFTNPQSQAVVAKVYGFDPKYQWLVADLVKPITNVDEFEQLSGIDWRSFCDQVNRGMKNKAVEPSDDKFVKSVVNTALKNNLLRGDIAQQDHGHAPSEDVLSHWGKTPGGRLVLLDYGFTHEVWASHYSKNQMPKANDAGHDDKTVTGNGGQQNGTKKGVGSPVKQPNTKHAPGGTLISPLDKTANDKGAKNNADPSATKTVAPGKHQKPAEDNDEKTKRPGKFGTKQ